MLVQVVGCSHHRTPLEALERLTFSPAETREALDRWRRVFPGVEAVLLSTCNRIEVYAAAEHAALPDIKQIVDFLARFHGLDSTGLGERFYCWQNEEAIRHLFAVASSLDSMVLGEPQILAQVKRAYQTATEHDITGPLLHALFQAAIRTARRVAGETTIHQRRVSVASVAVADFARGLFERFDDKHALVIGAGKMAEETLRYLREEGVRSLSVVNRHRERAEELAARWGGKVLAWEELSDALAAADLIVSTTGSGEAVVTVRHFAAIDARYRRPLLILDLAVPRDFEPAIGELPDVYLYSLDDLQDVCRRNRKERDKELPAAYRIVEEETSRFMAELFHRTIWPTIERLRLGWQKTKEEELERLLNKLPELDAREREEVRRAFDRLVNKLLHPPLESLREESRQGVPRSLLEALARLFRIKD